MVVANTGSQDTHDHSDDEKPSIGEWPLLSDWQTVAHVWLDPSEFVAAALTQERYSQWSKAAQYWEKAAECSTSGLDRFWIRINISMSEWHVMDIDWKKQFQFRVAENWQLADDYVAAAKLWQTLEMYPRAARCYLKLENYQQAARMWENCNCWQDAVEAWKIAGIFGRVAYLYETKLGNLSAAATAHIQNNQVYKAGQLYRQLFQTQQQQSYLRQARNCFAEVEAWSELADIYIQMSDVDQAIELLQTHQLHSQLATLLETLDRFSEAADYWLKAQQTLDSGRCFALAQAWQQAAACYESLEAWQTAAEMWTKQQAHTQNTEIWLNVARCYRNVPNYAKAGEAAKAGGNAEAAIKDWSLGKLWPQVAELQEQLGRIRDAAHSWCLAKNYPKSAELFESLGESDDLRQAASCWEALRNWPQLAKVYERLEDFEAAALAWEKAPNYEAAIEALSKVPNLERIAEIYEQFLSNLKQAAHLRKELGQHRRAALLFEKSFKQTNDTDDLQAALCCWMLDENWLQVASAYECLGDIDAALQILVTHELYLEAARLAENHRQYRVAAEYWLQAERVLNAARCYQAGGYWKETAQCHEECGAWRTAAEYWKLHQGSTLDDSVWQDVARCYRLVPDYALAAEAAEQAGDIEAAITDWRAASRWHKVASLYESQGKLLEAAQTWSIAKEYSRAAELYEQLATNLDEQLEYLDYAANCWRQAKNWPRLGDLYERQGEYAKAASLWEEQNDLKRAIANWQQLHNWSEVARLYQALKEWALAVEFYQKADPKDWRQIYGCALLLADWDLAAKAAENDQYWLGAAEAYLKLGTPEAITKAATCLEQAQSWSRAATEWQGVGNIAKAKECWLRAKHWQQVIRLCEQLNTPVSWLEAAGLYERQLKQFGQAASLYFKYGHLPEARRCWKHCSVIEPLIQTAQEAGHLDEVAAIWEAKERWLELGDTLVAMGHYCAAVQKYHAAQHADPEPHTKKPELLPEPPQFELPPFLEGNSWIQKLLVGLVSIAELPALLVATVGHVVLDQVLRYRREREDYESRLQEVKAWEKAYIKQKQEYQIVVQLKLKNTLLQCGCREHCVGTHSQS